MSSNGAQQAGATGSPVPGRDARIFARLRDKPGALERLAGLLRRRAFPVRRFSIAQAEDGTLEIVLRVDGTRTSAIEADLRTLVDVAEVRRIQDPPAGSTRELVLARIDPQAAASTVGVGRPIINDSDGVVVEITGAPDEVDDALRRLGDRGAILGFVRSGEIAVPEISRNREET